MTSPNVVQLRTAARAALVASSTSEGKVIPLAARGQCRDCIYFANDGDGRGGCMYTADDPKDEKAFPSFWPNDVPVDFSCRYFSRGR